MAHPHKETLESIKYHNGKLQLLDQRRLPHETVFDDICSIGDICKAIKEMRVRGAPAIAVSGALAIAVAAERKLHGKDDGVPLRTADEALCFILKSCDTVMTSRPTAVNLSKTLTQLKADLVAAKAGRAEEVVQTCVRLAEEIYAADVAYNEGIMRHGAAHLLALIPLKKRLSILTICNTGALATSRYGTALGVVRQLYYSDKLERLYACETRPWNQGARLTVYECVQEGIPCTLICDSAAAATMRNGKIDAVIVGADRICQNGDTANKIGTYNLSVVAAHHGVPFFVAAPSTTLDPLTACGEDVIIEERETTEITHAIIGTGSGSGAVNERQRVVADGPHLSVWNPVFDITPAELITGGIITERGVVTPAPAAPFYDIGKVTKM
ncbi:putative Initiation factor 2 subunit family [Trypanosoma vivax]|uniref:Methylthioribose-1-phosphate isomerase n=1 Tax=Trypanosoma vivax (strain Y486) TaxID=1055687 RepID=G0UD03_TRYVY|nr:putative translation initiation factor 2 subunit [Trypanosoma vivax]KAH8608060.1 putative Initiation factor 2 subunit family [Trypanosoma vivax]CCC53713.1 putative translation initiation factor 2 subunit [Trypanosoma vivax Y486]